MTSHDPIDADLEISPAEVAALLRQGPASIVILDCRTAPEWEIARIEGSVHVPLDDLPRVAPTFDPPEGALVAVLCHHGRRSIQGALFLRECGIPARSIAGGIEVWSRMIDPTIPRYERRGLTVWKVGGSST